MTNREWLAKINSMALAAFLSYPMCRRCNYEQKDGKCKIRDCLMGTYLWLDDERKDED